MLQEDAAAIFAMLFGGYGELQLELLDVFTADGIVHILSVSGSHIILIAAVMAWLKDWYWGDLSRLVLLMFLGGRYFAHTGEMTLAAVERGRSRLIPA